MLGVKLMMCFAIGFAVWVDAHEGNADPFIAALIVIGAILHATQMVLEKLEENE